MDITRIEGGKIVESWHQEDILGLMQQLGMIPAPGQLVLLVSLAI
jgi:hypothetical protein